jgi:purine nucleoside permease
MKPATVLHPSPFPRRSRKRFVADVLLALSLCLVGAGAARAQPAAAPAPLEVRVVVVTTFEVGADTGDAAGELQDWVERYPLPETIAFPQGFHPLRYDPKDHVLALLTGVGKAHAAASVMALGMDPRFDLTHAYWILAGIGGIDPAIGSIGSAAWARHVVDGDLAYEIDARDMPRDWSTGIVPYDRARPFAPPTPPAVSSNGVQVFTLNAALTQWAYELTAELALPDDAKLQAARAGYVDAPAARHAPVVLLGDTLTADRFWIGAAMTRWAEQWVSYWTQGQGRLATTAEEDVSYLQALSMLAQAGKVDFARALDLRAASDFSRPPRGVSAAALLESEATGNYAGYAQAIEAAYLVGSPVVRELAGHWARYAAAVPTPTASVGH